MNILVKTGSPASSKEAGLIWVGEEDKKQWASLPADIRSIVKKLIQEKRFSGKTQETFLFSHKNKWLVLAGLGKGKCLSLDRVRRSAAVAARLAQASRISKLSTTVPAVPKASPDLAAQAVVEGVLLGTYGFQIKGEKPKEDAPIQSLTFLAKSGQSAGINKGVKRGRVIAEAVIWSRDLGNEPSNRMTPTILAQQARAAGKKQGFKVQVFEPAAIKKLKMEALIGVARGSREPARFVVMEYTGPGAKSKRPLVFVGKGITFDSGGISIKPSPKMDEMKFDMCGAAAVLGAMQAIAALKLPVKVIGLTPAAENMPGGNAQKPGDVVRALNGKTIEVLNTDAEGRLILADALSYAQKYKPKGMVDLATLTGACVVALGDQAAGVMGNDEKLMGQVEDAAERSGDKVWELPLWGAHTEAIRSQVADVKNIGNGKAGTITAAAFLKEFVGEIPWVHIDIAGVAWADATTGYLIKGGTGFGVRLLVELAARWK